MDNTEALAAAQTEAVIIGVHRVLADRNRLAATLADVDAQLADLARQAPAEFAEGKRRYEAERGVQNTHPPSADVVPFRR